MSEETTVETTGTVENVTDAQLDAITSGAEETAQPETPVEEAPKDEAPPPEKTVPLAALHEERQKRKELSRKMESMESRFAQVMQALQPQPQQQVPTVEADPVQYFQHEIGTLKQQLAARQQAEQQAQQEAHVVQLYKQAADAFASQNEDFSPAYNHFVSLQVNKLMEQGLSQKEALQVEKKQEFVMALQALQNGVNPAQMIYNMALSTGYKRPQQTQQEPRIEAVQKGLAASKSVGSAGSANTNQRLTLEALASMNDEDFEKNWAKVVTQ